MESGRKPKWKMVWPGLLGCSETVNWLGFLRPQENCSFQECLQKPAMASVFRDHGGWRLNREIIRCQRREAVFPVFLLTASHTQGSPWFHGCYLTFKHHKSLTFLISIAFGNSDFYQCVFRLPFMGPLSTILGATGSWLYGAIIMGRLVRFGEI